MTNMLVGAPDSADRQAGQEDHGRSSGRQRMTRAALALRLAPAAILVIVAIVGPLVAPYAATKVAGTPSIPPGSQFWFGTDSSGLDVFSRVLVATRLNVFIGVASTLLATVVGILIGLLIGMQESGRGPIGLLARGIARALDLLQALPAIIVGLIVVAFYGASTTTIILAISIIVMPLQARLVRTEVLRVRNEAYLEAARIAGLSELRLTLRHVLPNSSWPAVENTPFLFGVAVILTAALGFLGVGVPPPTAEWGSMLAQGASGASVGIWWPASFPALALIGSVGSVALAHSAFTGKLRPRYGATGLTSLSARLLGRKPAAAIADEPSSSAHVHE
jgi:peptide/nickel transport system permease protein